MRLVDSQADLSLAGRKGHFVGFVMRRLKCSISRADHLISFDTLVNNVAVFNLISTLSFFLPILLSDMSNALISIQSVLF